jgi:hypothetical protein
MTFALSTTIMKMPPVFIPMLFFVMPLAAMEPDLRNVGDSTQWKAYNREVSVAERNGRVEARVDAREGDGVIWFLATKFSEGSIEVDLRGKNEPGRSFIGLAFRGKDDQTYDAIYFRPFNFKIPAADRRARAVQYVSHPKFTWQKLRADTPGTYEKPIVPVPDPDDWFHVRLMIEGSAVTVFVNESPEATLNVTALSAAGPGRIGLWVGNGSGGEFANLRLKPKS